MSELLQNKLFISTRPTGQSDELKRLFAENGADLLEMPLIEIQQLSPNPQDQILLNKLDQFQWLIFTSPNGVRCFFAILDDQGITILPDHFKIGVIGKKTKKTVEGFGFQVAFLNPGNTAEEFVPAFIQEIKTQSEKPTVLLILGNLARNFIQDKLKEHASCSRINVYETLAPKNINEESLDLIRTNRYEMLIFTSPSTIQNFIKLQLNIPLENLRIACIGEVTAREAKKQGILPLVVAEDASLQGIVQSIKQSYSKKL